MYESLRERIETTKQQLKEGNKEFCRKHAKTVSGIADKVEGLESRCLEKLPTRKP